MLQTIVENYYNYYKLFAQADVIDLHEGSVSWIIPHEGEKGPAIAFRVHLNEENAKTELTTLIRGIRDGKVPQMWLVTPDASPENIIDIMKEKGFRDLSEGVAGPEPGMLLQKNDFIPYEEESPIICRKVSTKKDFESWIDVVNTALHGWDMIDAEHYFTWVESKKTTIWLAEMNGIAISTCATIKNNHTASLEFVSTLEEYRRRKAASLLCSRAVEELLNNGAETVTLSACGHSAFLYERLGFKKYFNNRIMKFDF